MDKRASHRLGRPLGVRLTIAAAAAAGLGVITVQILDSTNGSLESSDRASAAGAEIAAAAPTPIAPGDARITWRNLPSSLLSPVVTDGKTAWVAAAEGIADSYGLFQSGLYRFDPGSPELVRVASFKGRPTAAVVAGSDVVVGAGKSIIAVDSVSGVTREFALGGPLGDAAFVSALGYVDGRLFVAWDGAARVDEVDLASGSTTRSFDLTGQMPPAQRLAILDGELIASTPFGLVNGAGPGSVSINLGSGKVSKLDLGRPFSFAPDGNGNLVTTQSVPGGGLHRLSATGGGVVDAPSAPTHIPWNGRWDLLAVSPNGSLWGSVQGDSKIYVENPDGSLDSFALPILPLVESLPSGGSQSSSNQRHDPAVASRTVASMVTLADGSLVFVTDTPGGALGYIASR